MTCRWLFAILTEPILPIVPYPPFPLQPDSPFQRSSQLIVLLALAISIARHNRLRRLCSVGRLLLDLLRGRLCRLANQTRIIVIFPIVRSLLGHILTLVNVNLELAVLLDEVGEVFDGAGAAVGDGGVLGAGGEELDGGEAGDLVGHVVGGGVDFGDDDLGVVGRVGGVHFS